MINLVTKAHAANLSTEFGFGGIGSLGEGLTTLAPVVFTIAGLVLVINLVVGAVQYLTSGGNKEAVASAQNRITHTIIGFVLFILLFLVLRFIPEFFGFPGLDFIKGIGR
ncbi:hypothetical protein HY389_02200 [Candidatus Daviesbacteria bacterium]|nr:hypothetical protein [Candidatus Daviesbacteria bacterium]